VTSKTPLAQAIPALVATLLIAYSSHALAQQAVVEPSIPYTIQPRDKLLLLGASLLHTGSDWVELARFNGHKSPNKLVPGKTLNIPLRMISSVPIATRIRLIQLERG
jgi:hypothetical protein